MRIHQYQVDAFTDCPFSGNPAAVCSLPHWLDDSLLQALAEENQLSETAFFVQEGKDFALRWFTPLCEVDLCGHATLATAYVLFYRLAYDHPVVTFNTRGGVLTVERRPDGFLVMDFPARPPKPVADMTLVGQALQAGPLALWAASDYLAVFEDEAAIRSIKPDFVRLAQLDLRGVIVTAPGDSNDFVSRFFAPKCGVPEDPVTGSAHCTLAPYWATRLGNRRFHARQLSRRGGELYCEHKGERVLLTARATMVMDTEIFL